MVRQESRRVPAGVADETGDIDLNQGEIVEVEAPSPDSCRLLVYPCVVARGGLPRTTMRATR
jgi:hypothetical protein